MLRSAQLITTVPEVVTDRHEDDRSCHVAHARAGSEACERDHNPSYSLRDVTTAILYSSSDDIIQENVGENACDAGGDDRNKSLTLGHEHSFRLLSLVEVHWNPTRKNAYFCRS